MSHSIQSEKHPPQNRKDLWEVVALFLKFGFTAFGGPAAHIGMFHDEVVKRRKWLDDQQFLDLLGAVNLIPGPNSTEMAIHLGYLRAGWPGLVFGGLAFILPAMAIVMALAWAYMQYGATPQAAWLLYGIKPVVIAIILQALYGLATKAIRGRLTVLALLVTLGLYLLGVNPLACLLAGGVTVLIGRQIERGGPWQKSAPAILLLPAAALATQPFSLLVLFLTFLKIGAVLYGSGYVLIAFLRNDFILQLGWLTDQQLLEAVAIGQVTPGPLFTTATFIGFLLAGVPGALVATLGIFLPSFVFVALSNRLIPRLREWPWTAALLDGVNVASLGLMGVVTVELAQTSLIDLPTVVMALLSAVLLLRFKVNSTWLIMGGAALGFLLRGRGL